MVFVLVTINLRLVRWRQATEAVGSQDCFGIGVRIYVIHIDITYPSS